MIDLNPLVKERHPIPPPAHCPPDELSCVWYSLTDKISYLPGDLITGDVTYTCAFTDLKNGLQTHCYAPAGLSTTPLSHPYESKLLNDPSGIRDKWTLNGTIPTEEPQPPPPGINAPRTGLYIREDVEMKCNMILTTFVKRTLKKSHATLIERLKAKAEILSQSPEEKVGGRVGENPLALGLVGTGTAQSAKTSGVKGPEVVRNTGGLSPEVMRYYERQVQIENGREDRRAVGPQQQQQERRSWQAAPQYQVLSTEEQTYQPEKRASPQPEQRYEEPRGRPASQPQPQLAIQQPASQPQIHAPRKRTPPRGTDDQASLIPEPLKLPSSAAKRAEENSGAQRDRQQEQGMEAPKFQGPVPADSPIGATLKGPFIMGPP